MAIISEYEEQPESIKKPFSTVLDCANPLGFLKTAIEFVANEIDLFKNESVIRDLNGLVGSMKEKIDSKEKKRKEKAVSGANNGAAGATGVKRAKDKAVSGANNGSSKDTVY